ncbi:MAG: DUF2680 domain-containing protein [Anaerolineae bacterium]|nr:DUF2680 domain-containing protein [Anaerolineae bacterium]
MNRTTKFLIAGLTAVVIIVGLVALNLSGGAAFAQSPTATPTTPGGPGHGGPGRGPAFGGPAFGRPGGADVLGAAAQALGMTTQDVMTQLQAGKTLADLAQSKGVSQDAVKQAIATAQKAAVDAAVTAGRLTADQATQAKQRIDQEVAAMDLTKPGFGFGFGRGPQPGGAPQPNQGAPRPDFGGRGPGFGGADVPNAIAKALGMTAQDLMTELKAGKTLADVAQAKGVSQDALKQAIANAQKAAVDAAVTAGRLTADQATQAKQQIDQRVAALDLTKPGFGFGPGPMGPGPLGGGPMGGKGGPGAPAFGRPGGADVLGAVAQALGMTTQDVMTQLQAGKTLADLAQSKGVSQDAVKQAIANAQKAAIDAAVTAGRLTADQATQAKQRIDQAVASLDLTKPGFGHGPDFRGPKPTTPNPNGTTPTTPNGRPTTPFRGRPGPNAPAVPTTPSGTSL